MGQREDFLDYVRAMVDYWESAEGSAEGSQRKRLEGLAFSILAALDGVSGSLPAYSVIPLEEGQEPIEGDLGRALHEQFYHHGNWR